MSTRPLTHHEILALVEPFARRGRHVDLAASDRMGRRIAFRAVDHPAGEGLPAMRETLRLEQGGSGRYSLERILALPDGLRAMLVAEGRTPAEVLELVEAVPPARQIVCGPGWVIARGHRGEPGSAAGGSGVRLTLTEAHARVDGLALALRVPRTSGIPADIELTAAPGDTLDLPEDFLAVLGWPWTRLAFARGCWSGSLRLRGSGPDRTADAEAKFTRTVRHVARTLAEPPRAFHERQRAARWRVTLRRAVPLLVCFAMLGLTALVASADLPENSVWRMLVFHAPPLLLLLFVALPEMPSIEIPRPPRRLTAPSWRTAWSEGAR